MGLTQVSTDGVKNDAITKTKIPANQIEASELADNAVDTNAIADQAVALSKLPHGDGSSNGKFLRANNGADPSFESIPAGTTINNNADNRVITGSGTANTLNGESNLTFNGSTLAITGGLNVSSHSYLENMTLTAATPSINFVDSGNNPDYMIQNQDGKLIFTNITGGNTNRMVIDSSGNTHFGSSGTLNNSNVVSVVPADGRISFGMDGRSSFVTGENGAYIYSGDGVSGATIAGDLILQSRSNQDRTIRFVTGSSPAQRVSITNNGLLFGTDTAAANALDDYEEGTWTPAFSGLSNTPVLSASGKYVKVGSIVYASAYMQATGTSPTFTTVGDPLIITGIPFTANGTGYTNAHGVLSWSQMDPWGSGYNETPHGDTTGHILVGLESGTNTVFYVSGANNTQRGRVKNNALHNSGYILEWSITYQTNS